MKNTFLISNNFKLCLNIDFYLLNWHNSYIYIFVCYVYK